MCYHKRAFYFRAYLCGQKELYGMRVYISGKKFDEERALYNLQDAQIENCVFAGPADGESALKESRNIIVKNCSFSLRYPFWHVRKFAVESCFLDEFTRAPVWYAFDGVFNDCTINGTNV